MKRLLWIFIFLPVLLQAEPRVESISRFAGLNTAVGDMDRQPNAAIVSINCDYSRYGVGTFGVRLGYDSVSFLAGMDEIIGLDAVYLSDYRQYLGTVWDSSGVGYGGIYVSPFGKAQLTGGNIYTSTITGANNFYYYDTIIIGTDTIIGYYTSGTDDALSEIATNLRDSLNADPDAATYFTITAPKLKLIEDAEGITVDHRHDANQSIDTTPNVTGKVWNYFSVQNKPSFAQFNDEWFIVNGAQKGVRYNGTVARSWPPNAPGEPTIVPLSDVGPMDGEYRYSFTYLRGLEAGDSSYGTAGTVTTPIRVSNGQVLLKDFQWVGADTIDAAPDTVGLVMYRTRANPGRLDQRDSAFLIDTVWGTSAANLATKLFIDSTADDDLGAGISIWVDDFIGRDSTMGYDHRYGAPTYLDCDSVFAYDSATDTTYNAGIYHGIIEQVDTLGVLYICTFIDTVLGNESNAGPPLAIMQADTAVKAWSQRIGLPTPVDGDSGIVRNVYRAHILQVTRDSAFNVLDSLVTANYGSNSWYGEVIGHVREGVRDLGWVNRLAVDTVVLSEYRLVAQVSLDSTAFTDSIRYDSLYAQPVFRGAIPPLLSGIFSHDNFLFGWDGSFLVWSDLDSAGNWGAFNRQSVNRDDGDAITVAFATRTGIRILKNYTNYNLYDTQSKLEKVGDWGCIAPRSYAAADNGHFYLSARGVVFETEGLQLERTVVSGLVSKKLRNFDLLTIETKREAVGRWYPTEGKYWLTINDTNYVYDKRASDLLGEEVWTIWTGMVFTDGTLYNTEDVLAFLPGSDFYFIQDGSSNLYRYGFSDTDPRTTPIAIEWENANLFLDPGWKSEVTGMAIRGFSDSTSDILLVTLRDETGAATESNVQFDSLNQYYRAREIGANLALEHGIEIKSNPPSFPFQGGRIERIDIWFEPRVEPIIMR